MLTCLCIEILYRFQNVWMFVDSEFTSFVKGSNVNRYLAKILLAAVQWCYFCSDFCLQSPPMYWVETDETITELQPDSRRCSSYHERFCFLAPCGKHTKDLSDHFFPVFAQILNVTTTKADNRIAPGCPDWWEYVGLLCVWAEEVNNASKCK